MGKPKKPVSPCYDCQHRERAETDRFPYSDYTVYRCRAPVPAQTTLPGYMWKAIIEVATAVEQHNTPLGCLFSPSSVKACELRLTSDPSTQEKQQ